MSIRIAVLSSSILCLSVAAGGAASLEPEQLERHEDLTESLANSLHDLSLEIRQRDLDGIAAHLEPNDIVIHPAHRGG